MNNNSIAIVGGGAAGLMAAATILANSSEKTEVTLFEKNLKLGSKVIISGGGRCNLTTGITSRKSLLSKYIRGGTFLKTAIAKLPPRKVIDFFESHGVKLKTELDLRVFPESNNGEDIVKVFTDLFATKKIKIKTNENINLVEPKDSQKVKITSSKSEYEFDSVILTTGGSAYSHTGSSGDGYTFAKAFNHKITPLGPALSSFICKEDWLKSVSGLSLDNAKLEACLKHGQKVSTIGPVLFTHFGMSGPAIFALSSHFAFQEISEQQSLSINITPFYKIDYQEWNSLMINYFDKNGSKQIISFLKDYFPKRLAQIFLDLIEINSLKKGSEISKQDRLKLVKLLSGGLNMTAIKRRPGDEFVTAGGVDLDEVNSKTMQSKLHPSLYFAGELLNIDAVTGGFNLQSSWATGFLAGKSVCA